MTRAELVILGKHYPRRVVLHWSSDAYPKTVHGFLNGLAVLDTWPSLEWLVENNPAGDLQFGGVGNPYYFYEVNLATRTVRGWRAASYWVRAPADWRKRGWNCWQHEINDSWGYMNFRRGAPVDWTDG